MAQITLNPQDVFLRSLTAISGTDRLVVATAAGLDFNGITWNDFLALLPSGGGSTLTVTFSTDNGQSYSATPVGTVTNVRFDDGTNPAVSVALAAPGQTSHVSIGPTAPASPEDGHLWSNTAANQLEQWDAPATAWIIIGPGGATPTPPLASDINVAIGGPNVAVAGTTDQRLALFFRDPVDVFSGADLAAAQTARDAGIDATALAAFDADMLLAIMLRVGTTDIIEHRVSGAWQQIGGAGGGGSGIPDGGTTAQALVKASNTDGDAEWGDADAIAGFEAAVDARVDAAVLTVTTTTDMVTKIERRTWTGDLAFAAALTFIASDPDAPPANFLRIRFNLGRATDTATSAYAGQWHELSRAQYDALTPAAAGDTVIQATARLYRDFIDLTITSASGITGRDIYYGKDVDGKLLVASGNASEDAYPATVIYETESEVEVVTGVTVIVGGTLPPPHSGSIFIWAQTTADVPTGIPADAVETTNGMATLPDFTQNSYIVVAQLASLTDISNILEGGINQFGAYEKGAATFTDGSEAYEYWATAVQQLGGTDSGGDFSFG